MQSDACDTSHRCLHSFGIIDIHRVGRTENMLYPEPISKADNRSQVTGVLHIIQSQTEGVADDGNIRLLIRLPEHSQHLLGSFQQAGTRKFLLRYFRDIRYGGERAVPGKPF